MPMLVSMKTLTFLSPIVLVFCLTCFSPMSQSAETPARDKSPASLPSPALQKVVDGAVAAALDHYASEKLQSNQFAVTVMDLSESTRLPTAGFRANAPIYPASVIKLFYLVAAHRWME